MTDEQKAALAWLEGWAEPSKTHAATLKAMLAEAWMEIAELKHDLERHIGIASDLATELFRDMSAVEPPAELELASTERPEGTPPLPPVENAKEQT